jgi:apolipoprotein N-acyltransferase
VDLLVWPEHAVSFYVQEPSPARDRLVTGLHALGVDVVLGAPHHGLGAGTEAVYTNAVFLARRGRFVARYDKRRLLPVAETHASPAYTPGRAPVVLPASVAGLGPLVCFEAMFPRLTRSLVAAGAGVLVNVTNDSWFGAAAAMRQHLEMAIVRAIEVRRPLVRAAATGVSAVVDAAGRILARTEIDRPATLLVRIVPGRGVSGYAAWGDGPLLLAIGLTVARVLWLSALIAGGRRS